MVIAATAGTAAISSATTDGGLINKSLKIAFIVLILGGLIIAFMWVTGNFSLQAVIDEIKETVWGGIKTVFFQYTPLGWAVSAASGLISIQAGKAKTFYSWVWNSNPLL